MKITIVCGFFLPVPPVAGGALEKMWWRLSRIFARRGHEVTLISRCWPGWPDQEIIEGVKLVRVPGFDHRARLWQNLLLDGIWGLRVLWVLPSADILVTNTVALPVFVRQLRSRAGTLVVNLNRFPKGQVRWYGRAARIQAASRIIAQAAIRQAPARAAIIRVTPNPVDCTLFAGPVPSRDHDAALTIGYIGRINPEKGLLTLINAAVILAGTTDLPPWRIVLRGPVDVPRGGGGEAFAHALRTMAPRLWDEQRIVLSPPLFDPVALAQS
jgi:glycosyltransferase involved in cell wall biosynthesis